MRKFFFFLAAIVSLNLMATSHTVKYNDVWYEVQWLNASGGIEYWAIVMNSNGLWEEIKSTEYDGDIVVAEIIHDDYDYPVTTVGLYAFYEAELTSIELPSKLETIMYHAFYGCNQLSYIVCHRAEDLYNDGHYVPEFKNVNIGTGNYETIPASDVFVGVNAAIPVYVPDEVVDTYKNSPWGDFFTNILPLSAKPEAIDNTSVEAKSVKRIENGQLLIERNGKTYNACGQEVR